MADNVIALEMFTNLVNNINEVKPKRGKPRIRVKFYQSALLFQNVA